MARHPLGDVRHRQVRDQSSTDVALQVEAPTELLARVHDVALVDHHALRRPGRPGRVDQRGEVARRGRRRQRVQVGLTAVEQLARRQHALGQHRGRIDHEHVLDQRELGLHLEEPLEEALVLEDHELRTGVAGEVGDLLRRRRVVDADAGRPEELDRRVEPVEVGTVAHHQQHPITRLDAVLLEAGCRPCHEVRVGRERPLVPRAGLLAVHRPQRDDVAVGADRLEELAGCGLPGHRLVDLFDGCVRHRGPLAVRGAASLARVRRVGLRGRRRYKLDPRVNTPAVSR